MILISGLKQLQNTAAFHNEERNHSNMWGGRGGGGEGREKKEGQCEGEQRGGSSERMCACSARKHAHTLSRYCSLCMHSEV